MKTLEQIIKSKPVYLNDWSESKKLGVLQDFNLLGYNGPMGIWDGKIQEYNPNRFNSIDEYNRELKKLKSIINKAKKNYNILFASYVYEDYSGDAVVLFERDGKLYEVYGSHCSCYGLEGQWEEGDEVVLDELVPRIANGERYEAGHVRKELLEFLGVKEK